MLGTPAAAAETYRRNYNRDHVRDLYEILGVARTASADEIRSAYRKLARKYHPDINPGNQQAEDRFKEVAAAYDVLSNENKRKAYDEFGEASLREGFDPAQARTYRQWKQSRGRGGMPFDQDVVDLGDLEDMFGDMFGGPRRGRGARGRRRGTDLRAVAELDLADAIHGAEVSIVHPVSQAPIHVRIPKGADTGSTLRVPGKGTPGLAGGPPGDLIIETRIRPHERVVRQGLDLTMKVPVTLDEAYSGASIEVPTFTGPVRVRVPPQSQPGTRLRLRGKGIERGKQRGDFYIELDVRLPDRPDEQLAQALRQARDAYSQPVRREIRL